MSIVSKLIGGLTEVATGGLADRAMKVAEKWFPPDMSEEQKMQARLAMKELESKIRSEMEREALSAEEALTQRIATLEGTASDLKAIPFFGPVALFLRGLQRPAWGFMTMWIDVHVFSGSWELADKELSAVWIVNLLVLGFLFGERAVRNLLPLAERVIGFKVGRE